MTPEPKYGAWTADQLSELIHAELNASADKALTPVRQQLLAMKIAKHTGASYHWILQHIERHGPRVRFA